MTEKFFCASRAQSPLGARLAPDGDEWTTELNGDRTCSFCGSLHPDDFAKLVERAAEPGDAVQVDRSDKAYKWYVTQPGVMNATEGGIKFYTWHVPDQEYLDRINANMPKAVAASEVKSGKVLAEIMARRSAT